MLEASYPEAGTDEQAGGRHIQIAYSLNSRNHFGQKTLYYETEKIRI